MSVACFPGSFDPATVAHLAVAEAARTQGRVARVELVLSVRALGKEHLTRASVDDRVEALAELATAHTWLSVAVTEARLVADIARPYDAVVLGADKWRQVVDPAWYDGDAAARDRAVAALPRVLAAPRGDDDLAPIPGPHPPAGVLVLALDPAHRAVSATEVRAGRDDWRVAGSASTSRSSGPAHPGAPS